MNFFDFTHNADNTFSTFSLNHIIPLLLIVLGVVLIILFRETLRESKNEKRIRYALAVIAIVLEVSFQLWQMVYGKWNFFESLPLHLCRLTNYIGIYTMFTKNQRTFEVGYMWSLAGVVSVMFPDILHGPDRYRYYHFMFSHMLFFYMYMYMFFVLQLKINVASFKKGAATLLLLVLAVIIPINNIFDMNYMYLLYPGDTPFSIFWGNGYIIYVLGCIVLTFIVMVLWYAPIHIYNTYFKKEVK